MRAKWSDGEESSFGKENSKKHPDAKRNLSHLQGFIHRKEIKRACQDYSVDMVWSGTNKDSQGNFEEITNLSVYWKKASVPYGFSLNLNQPHAEFVEDVNKRFGIMV